MVMRRIYRRWLSSTLVLTILFAQLATAAYACPAMRASDDAAAPAASTLPCAQMMGAAMLLDPDQPGLCQQHCQFGNTQQAGDPAQALALSEVNRVVLFVVNPALDTAVASARGAIQQPRREAAPPHSVLHCCYRF